jgi:hypothetical protein
MEGNTKHAASLFNTLNGLFSEVIVGKHPVRKKLTERIISVEIYSTLIIV